MTGRQADDGGLRTLFREHLANANFVIDTNERDLRGTAGSPDINYAFPGGEGWIECKAASAWRPKFKVPQVGWLTVRAILRTRVWIAVRRADTELWLIPGGCVRDLQRDGLRAPSVAERIMYLSDAPRPGLWDWAEVRRILTGPAPAP
jgi:hypothetical protein